MSFVRLSLLGTAAVGLAALLACSGPPAASAGGPGEEIFTAQTCNVCHAVPAAGIEAKMKAGKMKGPDLPTERDADWMRGYVTQAIAVDGRKHAKKFTGSEDELATLLAWLGSLSGSGK